MAKAIASNFYSSRCIKGQNVPSDLDRTRPFFMVVLSVLLTLTILGAIFYIGLRVKVVNLGYRINQEIQSKEQVIEENKRLSLEIARLKSPTRIEFEAKERLGLQLPAPHQIIYLGKDAAELDVALAKIKPLPVPLKEIEAPVVAQKKLKNSTVATQSKPAAPTVATQGKPVAAAVAVPNKPATSTIAVPSKPVAPTVAAKTKAATPAVPAQSKPATSTVPAQKALLAKESPAKPVANPQANQPLVKPQPKEVASRTPSEKTATPLLIAKNVRPRDEKNLSIKKTTDSKPRQAPIREGISAAMLDTMP